MSNNLLKGKKGIIFGALDEKSIAWRTALKCYDEGAQIVLTNAPVALRMGVRKVKRKSGWWWVPPGVKEPTKSATAEDPYADPPKKGWGKGGKNK